MERQVGIPFRAVINVVLLVAGIVLSVLALGAQLIGINLTPGFGIIQMAQLLAGITLLTLAGYSFVNGRRRDKPRSLQADIAVRLGLSGLVLCYVAGFSDLIGVGTHVAPRFERPFIGPWQLSGLLIGVLSIVAGLLLYHTSRGIRMTSSLQFLIPDDDLPPENRDNRAIEDLSTQTDS